MGFLDNLLGRRKERKKDTAEVTSITIAQTPDAKPTTPETYIPEALYRDLKETAPSLASILDGSNAYDLKAYASVNLSAPLNQLIGVYSELLKESSRRINPRDMDPYINDILEKDRSKRRWDIAGEVTKSKKFSEIREQQISDIMGFIADTYGLNFSGNDVLNAITERYLTESTKKDYSRKGDRTISLIKTVIGESAYVGLLSNAINVGHLYTTDNPPRYWERLK